MNDPKNARARAGYERTRLGIDPGQTKFLAGIGLQYESNVRLEDKNTKNDVSGQFIFRIDDDRRLGTQPWRSSFQSYVDFHASERDADFIYVNGQTGPVFVLDNGWQVHVAANIETGLVKYNWLYWAAGLNTTIQTRGWDPLRSVNIAVAYADYANQGGGGGSPLGPSSNAFEGGNGRDGVVAGIRALFAWDNVLTGRDNFGIRPSFIYDNARDSQFRFWQAGLTFTYLTNIGSAENGAVQFYFSPEVMLNYRSYAGRENLRTHDRNDKRVSPGAKLIATRDNITAVLSYTYDRAFSTYDAEQVTAGCCSLVNLSSREYANHRVGLNIYVDF